jgi:HK97 family phage prohead protease
VFDIVDRARDRLRPGAFTDSLLDWKRRGRMPPLIWGHRHDDPSYRIGKVLDAREDDRGLVVHAQLDLTKPKAVDTYDLLKANDGEFSFAFETKAATLVRERGRFVRDITAVNLLEVGPCLIGVNPDTALLGIKADGADDLLGLKAGRTLSAATRGRLRAIAQELIEFVETYETPETATAQANAALVVSGTPSGCGPSAAPLAALYRRRLALWAHQLGKEPA